VRETEGKRAPVAKGAMERDQSGEAGRAPPDAPPRRSRSVLVWGLALAGLCLIGASLALAAVGAGARLSGLGPALDHPGSAASARRAGLRAAASAAAGADPVGAWPDRQRAARLRRVRHVLGPGSLGATVRSYSWMSPPRRSRLRIFGTRSAALTAGEPWGV
jgi:hypothetical protein